MAVKLSDLAEPISPVAASARLSTVIQKFTSQTDIPCVVVLEEGRPLGILTRIRAMEMAATSHEAVNSRLCVGDVVEIVPQFDGEILAFSLVMNRHEDDFSRLEAGALVMRDNKVEGVLSLPALLRAVAREQAVIPKSSPEKGTRSGAEKGSATLPVATVLGALAHEVRTPLTGIMGLAEILQQRVRETELKQIAEAIIRSGEALDRILSDTLDFASLQAGQLKLSPEPCDISDFATDLRRLWGPVATSKGLGFKVSLQSDVGSLIDVDLGRLRQVANNLISNALKFTRSGRVDVSIAIDAGARGAEQLRLDVSDTGPGLSPAQKDVMFDFFVRGDAVRDEPGWGLGLSICKALSGHLGGALKVHDRPGGGTVFSVCLPVQPIQPNQSGGGDRVRIKTGKFRLGRILLVEDHDACGLIFQTALVRAGWEVDHVKSLSEAADYLDHQTYQAVLTDLHLLDGSALSLIDALRQRSDIPETMAVIALTADTRTAATSLALAHGADRVVTKPVRGPELVAQVSEVLLKRGALDDEPVPRRLNRAV